MLVATAAKDRLSFRAWHSRFMMSTRPKMRDFAIATQNYVAVRTGRLKEPFGPTGVRLGVGVERGGDLRMKSTSMQVERT